MVIIASKHVPVFTTGAALLGPMGGAAVVGSRKGPRWWKYSSAYVIDLLTTGSAAVDGGALIGISA